MRAAIVENLAYGGTDTLPRDSRVVSIPLDPQTIRQGGRGVHVVFGLPVGEHIHLN